MSSTTDEPPGAPTAKAPRVRRACDGCRVRKVRCDGMQPCAQCTQHSIRCVTTPEAEKRKNPIRGRLVAKARGNIAATSPDAAAPGSTTMSGPSPSSPASSLASRYTPDFFRGLIPQFEELVYPFSPAISSVDILAAIPAMDHSVEDAALVFAFGATTIYLSHPVDMIHGDVATQLNDLIQCSLEAHRRADLRLDSHGRIDGELPVTNRRIMTSIYLEISMMAFKLYDRSFSHIREAITMIQTKLAHDQRDDSHTTSPHLAAFQRLYWEAYIHERFLTIASGFPSILPPLKTGPPLADPGIPLHIEVGFNRLIHLFLILDDTFLTQWDGREDRHPKITVDWIESKQVQLDQDEIDAAEAEHELLRSGHPGLSEHQRADLFITRLWLRTLLWQVALSKGFLRSTPAQNTHEALSLQFPALRLSNQLRSLVGRLDSIASIGTQGSGILQKLFEITSTIADVLALSPLYDSELDTHIEDFLFIAKFLFNFERMRDRQRAYLLEKVDLLRRSHPTSGFSDLPSPAGYWAQLSTPLDHL